MCLDAQNRRGAAFEGLVFLWQLAMCLDAQNRRGAAFDRRCAARSVNHSCEDSAFGALLPYMVCHKTKSGPLIRKSGPLFVISGSRDMPLDAQNRRCAAFEGLVFLRQLAMCLDAQNRRRAAFEGLVFLRQLAMCLDAQNRRSAAFEGLVFLRQ